MSEETYQVWDLTARTSPTGISFDAACEFARKQSQEASVCQFVVREDLDGVPVIYYNGMRYEPVPVGRGKLARVSAAESEA